MAATFFYSVQGLSVMWGLSELKDYEMRYFGWSAELFSSPWPSLNSPYLPSCFIIGEVCVCDGEPGLTAATAICGRRSPGAAAGSLLCRSCWPRTVNSVRRLPASRPNKQVSSQRPSWRGVFINAVTSLLEDFCTVFDIVGRCHGEQGFSRTCTPFKELFSFFSVLGRSNPEWFPFGTASNSVMGLRRFWPWKLKREGLKCSYSDTRKHTVR